MLKNNKIKYAIITALVVVAGFVYLFSFLEKNLTMDNALVEAGTLENMKDCATVANEDASSTTVEEAYVYVSGYVKAPGVYKVAGNSRVVDAIEAAGGFLKEADTNLINLARAIKDGEHIHIYSVQDNIKPEAIEENAGLVNINTATKEQLTTLPGIGSSKAEGIIAYRDKNGSFNSCEDIMKVTGIKEAAYEKIKALICVE